MSITMGNNDFILYIRKNFPFWLNLQNRYDLETTEDLLGNRLNKEVNTLQANTINIH